MHSCNLLIPTIQKSQITPVLHCKSWQQICAFYFSATEGDDLSCHVAEQFNNGFIIIFQKTQKTSWTGPVKCLSVCAFCVWLSKGNDLIWHISEQQNNNISAWSFLIVGENKRLQAIHPADGLLWHRLLLTRQGSVERIGGFRCAGAQMYWQGNTSWSRCLLRSQVWLFRYSSLCSRNVQSLSALCQRPVAHLARSQLKLFIHWTEQMCSVNFLTLNHGKIWKVWH